LERAEDDGALIARCLGGEKDAFSSLVVRYQDRIWNAVYQRLGDAHATMDVAQEAFVNAYRALSTYRSEGSFYGWLFTIAMNEVRDHQRKTNRTLEKRSLDAPHGGERLEGRHVVAAPDDVAARDDEEHAEVEVRAALAELDEDDARVLVLKDIEGLPYADIAKILAWPLGQVKSKVHRARLRLRRKLELRERARTR
jgi:RNA polymerase sigma-70 factor (ECF subfamily)